MAKVEQWKEQDVWIYFFTSLFSRIKPDRNSMAKNQLSMATFYYNV